MPTLETIAEKAGVSRSTVAAVLRGSARATRPSAMRRAERVRSVAERLGYRPNSAARAVSTGRFRSVVLVQGSRESSSDLPLGLLESLCDALDARDYHLTIARLTDAQLTDAKHVPRFLAEWMCDGLILNYHAGTPRRLVELVEGHRLPVVWLNLKRPTNAVRPDDVEAARRATELLLTRGHRRIAYVDRFYHVATAMGHRHYSKDDRRDGYTQAMQSAGLAPQILTDAEDHSTPRFIQDIAMLLRQRRRVTGFVAYSAESADCVLRAACETGCCGRVEVVAGPTSRTSIFQYEHLILPSAAMGRAAVEMIMQRIENPEASIPSIVLPCDLHPGLKMSMHGKQAEQSIKTSEVWP